MIPKRIHSQSFLTNRKSLKVMKKKPGVILDYDAAGNLVSMEIMDASRRVSQPMQMVYELAAPKKLAGVV